ncbi:hypothetical protein RGU12_00165 [Fredinandcohnia sp. QZ13]|nr:hypothetical protein [Fredinandcohnia sp. QZ13]MDR4885957.1 hypothetical protein [Fredinandcohnia sp. QZ13]
MKNKRQKNNKYLTKTYSSNPAPHFDLPNQEIGIKTLYLNEKGKE